MRNQLHPRVFCSANEQGVTYTPNITDLLNVENPVTGRIGVYKLVGEVRTRMHEEQQNQVELGVEDGGPPRRRRKKKVRA